MITKSNESIPPPGSRRVRMMAGRAPLRRWCAALPSRLVEEHCGSDGDVEAVGRAVHRQPDVLDGVAPEHVAEARRLAAERDRERAPQVGLRVLKDGIDP